MPEPLPLEPTAVLAKLRAFLARQYGDAMATEIFQRCQWEAAVETQGAEIERLRAENDRLSGPPTKETAGG